MSLQSAYKQFLAAPNPSLLASDASLHYITTLVSVNGSSNIVKHLNGEEHRLKKKEETFLNIVEGTSSIAAEVHTTVEFKTSGGSYLPGLDDNFLADRTVTFPIIHIVSFDANGKIQQIRQNWDQGSLLKLIEVIGKSGRNWPIRDGKDQIKLITSSVRSSGTSDAASNADSIARARANSNNATRDPHSSLALFAPREDVVQESRPAAEPISKSAKPEPRDYHDLFVGKDSTSPEDDTSLPKAGAKAGASRQFAPSRLFDAYEEQATQDSHVQEKSKDPMYRPNPARYEHFDFTDAPEEEEPIRPTSGKGSMGQHQSQWGFDDFQTPQKVVPTKVLRAADVRHWGNSDDEVLDSPVRFKKTEKPRKDAQAHFEFRDEGTPQQERRIVGRPQGQGHNNGLGLYKSTLFDEDESETPASKKQGPSFANVTDRQKNLDSHFTMTDDSPVTGKGPAHIAGDRAKAVKNMGANWDTYDQSPIEKNSRKENDPSSPIRSNSTKEPLSETHAASQRNQKNTGIKTMGDGMGGSKGAGRSWGFGDGSDGEEAGGINGVGSTFRNGRPGKAQNQKATGGDFWDF
ncbi:hypothetical protein SS1G_01436 [Sclerotinia sclerotiorum 1980 UF-70]|uniref:NTF2 domain-containing protein n=2 Tax=Sclerotinia sclerotiorum (strain ATCC 18683 / 1980 / Ss-1) TaxID=665079 RepID=A7E808_SCLS1|nr:hypothetical protein SS1G_01436 [Sclerotinia sclerotiorum 1980 UF-70]APA06116.1 hypothetical protein sscle_01g008860 [Sclerotinia sclerotiorum 1980 UF-70]EDN96510.1 hypothetical protein SS1G_01436 [Sclerotinia sclerotiorum 1980 UF-70]